MTKPPREVHIQLPKPDPMDLLKGLCGNGVVRFGELILARDIEGASDPLQEAQDEWDRDYKGVEYATGGTAYRKCKACWAKLPQAYAK